MTGDAALSRARLGTEKLGIALLGDMEPDLWNTTYAQVDRFILSVCDIADYRTILNTDFRITK